MRLVRFGGAMSLDGYIAGPNGEHDWIVMDPEVDFGGGIPLLPPPAGRATLRLRSQRLYTKTGTIGLEYEIVRA